MFGVRFLAIFYGPGGHQGSKERCDAQNKSEIHSPVERRDDLSKFRNSDPLIPTF